MGVIYRKVEILGHVDNVAMPALHERHQYLIISCYHTISIGFEAKRSNNMLLIYSWRVAVAIVVQ